MSRKIPIFDKTTVLKIRRPNFKNIFIYFHESLDIVLKLFASYNSDAYEHFCSTVLFSIEKNENRICQPTSQNFEIFEFFFQTLISAYFCYLKWKTKKII